MTETLGVAPSLCFVEAACDRNVLIKRYIYLLVSYCGWQFPVEIWIILHLKLWVIFNVLWCDDLPLQYIYLAFNVITEGRIIVMVTVPQSTFMRSGCHVTCFCNLPIKRHFQEAVCYTRRRIMSTFLRSVLCLLHM